MAHQLLLPPPALRCRPATTGRCGGRYATPHCRTSRLPPTAPHGAANGRRSEFCRSAGTRRRCPLHTSDIPRDSTQPDECSPAGWEPEGLSARETVLSPIQLLARKKAISQRGGVIQGLPEYLLCTYKYSPSNLFVRNVRLHPNLRAMSGAGDD